MKKLSIIKRSVLNTYFTTKDNKLSFPLNLDYITFNSKIDIENKLFVEKTEENSILPTINELIANGTLIEKKYVNEFTLFFQENEKKFDYKKIQQTFKEHDFDVSIKSLKFIIKCWKNGLKGGYRGKGYHLFVPCGKLNPLFITATKTDSHFKDWQKTYYC